MHLYIMRHGIAHEPYEWPKGDATRPLTEKGKRRTREVLEKLADEKKLRIEALFSSPLVRARETAEIAADVLGSKVQILDALAAGTTLSEVQKAFRETKPLPERLMLVGHEPDCGTMVGDLISDPNGDYAFKKAGVASLEGEFAPGKMKLNWLIAPKDVLKDE